jgi:hypothetical protein
MRMRVPRPRVQRFMRPKSLAIWPMGLPGRVRRLKKKICLRIHSWLYSSFITAVVGLAQLGDKGVGGVRHNGAHNTSEITGGESNAELSSLAVLVPKRVNGSASRR